ncbi:MAG: hypothetical protein QM627_06495 [Luteolibacter sp.]
MFQPSQILRCLSKFVGTSIRDQKTGEFLGKAILLPWRGKIHIIGYTGSLPLCPVTVPCEHLSYWKATLGFTAAREPDFPNIR